MLKCNCAIINISADEEKKQGESYGMNENVLIEIGGAFLHYERRVILVIDKKLKDLLPSILQGLTAIFYEGDELSWNDGMRLQKALTEFREKL
jgi:predicted nucleotide-binding protein